MLLFIHIHLFAVLFIAMLAVALGFISAWSVRKKRIQGLEEKLSSMNKELLFFQMENGNLEEYKKHVELEKESLDKELNSLKVVLEEEKLLPQEMRIIEQKSSMEIEKLKRESNTQKKKINDLHLKVSNLSLKLKKEKDATANWKVKFARLGEDKKTTILTSNGIRKNNRAKINSDFEAKRTEILEHISSRPNNLDFDKIGYAYSKDDLKVVKGIGAFLEKKFNALQITSIAQIANLKEEDILVINEILGLPESKFEKELWVEKAQDLMGIKDKEIDLGKKLNTIASMRAYINLSNESDHEDERSNLSLINTLVPLDIAKLNALGIYSIEQIAQFSKTDCINVTNILGLPKDRIHNEYWIEQAKDALEDRLKTANTASAITDNLKTVDQTVKDPHEVIT